MTRCFVAVRPPTSVRRAIAALPRPDEPGVRWVPAEQWHVTIRFLGEVDLDAALAALDRARPGLAELESLEAELGPRVSRLGRNVICLPVQGLEPVAAIVAAATEGVGEPLDPRPFAAHLTLARLTHRGACRLAGHPFSRRFPVREVELVQSTLRASGPLHEVVAAAAVGA